MTTFGSVCSGIEAASVAWEPIGWRASWFSEISPFPSAVIAHHYPTTPNHGDMTKLPALIRNGVVSAPDVFTGGTPCQAFSMAGNRQSLSDDRGNLSLVFCEVADAIDDIRHGRGEQPAVILWENVPGVLSTSDNAFGCFLAQLVGESTPLNAPGERWPNAGIVVGPRRSAAWRVLDAQYFGLAQRRKRVFVVASARDDADIGQVLFEFDGVQRHTAPSRGARIYDTGSTAYSIAGNSIGRQPQNGRNGTGIDVNVDATLTTMDRHAVAFKFRSQGHYTGENNGKKINANASGGHGFLFSDERTFTIATTQDQQVFMQNSQAIAFNKDAVIMTARDNVIDAMTSSTHTAVLWQARNDGMRVSTNQETTPTLGLYMGTGGNNVPLYGVRQLTPRECERLQGFPDDYTLIPYRGKEATDAPRYHALGNSWPVPVVRWIGQRINRLFF